MLIRDLIQANRYSSVDHLSLLIDGVINVYDAVRAVKKVNETESPWPLRW